MDDAYTLVNEGSQDDGVFCEVCDMWVRCLGLEWHLRGYKHIDRMNRLIFRSKVRHDILNTLTQNTDLIETAIKNIDSYDFKALITRVDKCAKGAEG